MATLNLVNRRELQELAQQFHNRAQLINKSVEDNYLLARPFQEHAPAAQALNYNREAVLRAIEFRTPPFYVLDPDDWPRTTWDACAAALIMMDIFYIPFVIAFLGSSHCSYLSVGTPFDVGYLAHPYSRGWQIFPILVNAFFLVDLVVNCFTGYVQAQEYQGIESRLPLIWKRYAITWAALDVGACLPLQCLLSVVADGGFNIGYLLGLLRVFGLWRRAHGHPFAWVERLTLKAGLMSHYILPICDIIFACLVLLHYFVCLEWMALRWQGVNDGTWVAQLYLANKGAPEQYLFSIFNAISAMIMLTYGSYPPISWQEVMVWNVLSVSVAVAFVLVGLLIVAVIVEGSTWRLLFKSQMDDVMRALDTRDLPDPLKKRIINYYSYKLADLGRRNLHNTPALFSSLPDDMACEVAMMVCHNLLSAIPLFDIVPELLGPVALLLVSRPAHFIAGDVVTRQGWPAAHMFFIQDGLVDVFTDGILLDTLGPGHRVGEDALLPLPSDQQLKAEGIQRRDVSNFTNTLTSLSTTRALTNCSGFMLRAHDFHELVADVPAARRWLHAAAMRYMRKMREQNICIGREGREDALELLPARDVHITRPSASIARASLGQLFDMSEKSIRAPPDLSTVRE